jgi:hypothetical protein
MKAIIKIKDIEYPEYGEVNVGDPKKITAPTSGEYFIGEEIKWNGFKMKVEKIDVSGVFDGSSESDEDQNYFEFNVVIHLYCKAIDFEFASIF